MGGIFGFGAFRRLRALSVRHLEVARGVDGKEGLKHNCKGITRDRWRSHGKWYIFNTLIWDLLLNAGLHPKPPKFEHIFVAVITFSPFLLCKYF